MFDERSLTSALAEVGYRRFKPRTYKAEWSTEVEHRLIFYPYNVDYLAATFGLKNKDAEEFGIWAIETYGPEIHRLLRGTEDPDTCTMQFSLGSLASWGLRSSLTIPDMSGPALAAKIRHDVEQKLFPLVRRILRFEQYMSFLLVDSEPVPWFKTNRAIRAAIIVWLAVQLHLDRDHIHALLEPHHKSISGDLRDGIITDPGEYVEQLIKDASFTRQEKN